MQHLALQLLENATEELQCCHALLDVLQKQREALLARDAPSVLRTSQYVESILQRLDRIADARTAIEAQACALSGKSVPPTGALMDCLPEPDRKRWLRLIREIVATGRRIQAVNQFNQQLVLDALAYRDLLLRLLSGQTEDDAYPISRPGAKRLTAPAFLDQSV